jgi:hypothetical protein
MLVKDTFLLAFDAIVCFIAIWFFVYKKRHTPVLSSNEISTTTTIPAEIHTALPAATPIEAVAAPPAAETVAETAAGTVAATPAAKISVIAELIADLRGVTPTPAKMSRAPFMKMATCGLSACCPKHEGQYHAVSRKVLWFSNCPECASAPRRLPDYYLKACDIALFVANANKKLGHECSFFSTLSSYTTLNSYNQKRCVQCELELQPTYVSGQQGKFVVQRPCSFLNKATN